MDFRGSEPFSALLGKVDSPHGKSGKALMSDITFALCFSTRRNFFRPKCCSSFILIQKAFVAFFCRRRTCVFCGRLVFGLLVFFWTLISSKTPHAALFPRPPKMRVQSGTQGFSETQHGQKNKSVFGGEDVIIGEQPTSRSAPRRTYFKSISPQKFLSHFSISIWC